jgi:Kae1-associated kinase Bud32
MSKEQIIQQGAEAILIKKENILLKKRISKGYRIKELDEKIRKLRTRSESKLLEKSRRLVPIPKVLNVNEKTNEIDMEFIEGLKLSDHLDNLKDWERICNSIGENIAKLHDQGIVHGDLTTSNMIWQEKEKKLYFIDFGLGFANARTEDKAVDLYLIKEALEAKHFLHFEKFFKAVLEGYKISKNYKETLIRLQKVEKRGRYKQNY